VSTRVIFSVWKDYKIVILPSGNFVSVMPLNSSKEFTVRFCSGLAGNWAFLSSSYLLSLKTILQASSVSSVCSPIIACISLLNVNKRHRS
jgi:hypothetical protein